MNTQPRHPKCRALPVELHPDIQFLPLYHGGGENQRFFCLWSFLWSKPLLCRFRQSGEIPQTKVSQGFAAFRPALSRIQPRHSQSRRATNCATPGYLVFYPAGRILPNQARYQLRYTRILNDLIGMDPPEATRRRALHTIPVHYNTLAAKREAYSYPFFFAGKTLA